MDSDAVQNRRLYVAEKAFVAFAFSSQLLSTFIIVAVRNNPDWVFYRYEAPTEQEVVPRLLALFSGFRPQWP